MAEPTQRGRGLYTQDHDIVRRQNGYDGGYDIVHNDAHDDAGLKTLLKRLNDDASQFVHDELELAKLEFREVAGALSSDVKEAGTTLAKDLAKIVVAAVLALLGGLALVAGAIMAIGALFDGAYWAGGLIVGTLLMIAAFVSAKSAASDAQSSDALRLENTRRTFSRDKEVLADEVRETKEFAQREAKEFKEHASPGSTHQHH